jgi:hypothetical protein
MRSGIRRPSSDWSRRWTPGVFVEIWLAITAGVILALMIATAGAAMPSSAALADPDVRVIESDLAEPFVVCTTRAQATKCEELDLSTDHR